jgi:hypothetical protein
VVASDEDSADGREETPDVVNKDSSIR